MKWKMSRSNNGLATTEHADTSDTLTSADTL